MFSSEQELSIQVAHINRIQVNLKKILYIRVYDSDVKEAGHGKSFHKLTSDATSTYNEDLGCLEFEGDVLTVNQL